MSLAALFPPGMKKFFLSEEEMLNEINLYFTYTCENGIYSKA